MKTAYRAVWCSGWLGDWCATRTKLLNLREKLLGYWSDFGFQLVYLGLRFYPESIILGLKSRNLFFQTKYRLFKMKYLTLRTYWVFRGHTIYVLAMYRLIDPDYALELLSPNQNKISHRRSAARWLPVGLRVCSSQRDARSLLAASHG